MGLPILLKGSGSMVYGISNSFRKKRKSAFSLLEWLERIFNIILLRPFVFLLLMTVFGGYIAFFGSPFFRMMTAVPFCLLFGSISIQGKWKSIELSCLLLGICGFASAFIGFALFKERVISYSTEEWYEGTARVISSNGLLDGYKNITVKLDTGEKAVFLTDDIYEYSDILSIRGNLVPFQSSGNPGDMNIRDYYNRKGITRSIDSIYIRKVTHAKFSLMRWGYYLGSLISKKCYEIWKESTDEETSMILSAMVVGDSSHMEKETKESFRKSNLSHLLVVSGAHVAYFSSTIGTLCALFIKSRKKKIFAISLLLVLFGFISGWANSASRSILTYLLVSFLSLDDRCVDRVSSCAASALILILADPFSMFSQGLLLSFGATFSIMLFQRRATEQLRKALGNLSEGLVSAISCFLCAQVGMLPILIFMGNSLSLFSFISVFLAGFPAQIICSLGFVLTLISMVIPIPFLHSVLFVPIRGLVILLSALARMGSFRSGFRLSYHSMPVFAFFLASVILCILLPSGFRRRVAFSSACCLFSAFMLQTFVFASKESRIYFLDVGQGDCALITHNGINMLIDGGNQGCGKIIEGVMDYLNIDSIDMAFMSHLDSDHVGGIIELWEEGLVDQLYAPFWGDSEEMKQLLFLYPELPEDVPVLSADSVLAVDEDLSFHVIWPKAPNDGGNDDSMVIIMELYAANILFTGDISAGIEEKIDLSGFSEISVLKVAHHGSRFSTSEAFLLKKKYCAAVVSVGYNHYGHPSEEVLNRLEMHDIPCFRTDLMGCVLLTVHEDSWNLRYFFE